MIEANEVNSTFYALRMLSHGLDTSQIEVTDGEEYPASEFTKEEQEQALKIIRNIEDSESLPFAQLPPDKIDFYLTALADRIEELANSDLVEAGYAVEGLLPKPYKPDTESLMTGRQEAVSRSEDEGATQRAEGDEFELILPMGSDNELLVATTLVEQVARRLNFSPDAMNRIKIAVVLACLNASEHSLRPVHKIYLRSRVEDDKLVITISTRGIMSSNVDEHDREQTTGGADATNELWRGWGLKERVDEIEFDLEGTGLRRGSQRES